MALENALLNRLIFERRDINRQRSPIYILSNLNFPRSCLENFFRLLLLDGLYLNLFLRLFLLLSWF